MAFATSWILVHTFDQLANVAHAIADLKAALSRAEADSAGIKRELSRLPQAAN